MKTRKRFLLMNGDEQKSRAFTRIELLAVCAALLLVALVVAPAAVSSKSDAERLVCFNNLRLIGRGVQIWGGEHNQQVPWQTLVSEGGTRPDSGTKPGNAWLEFAAITNELGTPKILACPSDEGVLRVEQWGVFTRTYRNLALSYNVALHAAPDEPRSCLSGDRNIRFDSYGSTACSARVNDAGNVTVDPALSSALRWTNAVHGEFGHILRLDGSVQFTSTPRMREILLSPINTGSRTETGSVHFLKAR